MVLKSYSLRVKGLGLWCLGPIQGFRVQGLMSWVPPVVLVLQSFNFRLKGFMVWVLELKILSFRASGFGA